ncbi:MAG: hypothetical protein HGA45_02245 [Chloroflexales bacterium]|nr:hypothetical protein [Chloroflexales bacterium]
MSPLTDADLALVRRFEPVLAFTHGEQFYPMDVERYIAAAALCVRRPDGAVTVLVPRGELTVERLIEPRTVAPGSILYLHFVKPFGAAQALAFRSSSSLHTFRPGRGRLARVGLISRLGDMLFFAASVVRGRTPGGAAAAAAVRYQAEQAHDEHYCYYARVVRQHGYLAIQYWFFYAFNDWRSSFDGVNDHEADWELVTVYLDDGPEGPPRPVWLAYSSHEFRGDDLRRRWDDPDLRRVGEHPVVFVSAGAHANYFFAGDYLPSVPLPYADRLLPIWQQAQRIWQRLLGQPAAEPARSVGLLAIPFVEYARGDGLRVGSEQAKEWRARFLQATPGHPEPPWLDSFRGCWGLVTGDPLAGEDGPARPKYHRDGTLLDYWYNPVGWCGLDAVPPPHRERDALEERLAQIRHAVAEQSAQVERQVWARMALERELLVLRGLPDMAWRAARVAADLRAMNKSLAAQKLQLAASEQAIRPLERAVAWPGGLSPGDPRAHLRSPQLPFTPAEVRLSALAEGWSAVSVSVVLLGTVVLSLLNLRWQIGLLAMFGIYTFVEALFHRRVARLVQALVTALALVAAAVLAYTFARPLAVALLLGLGVLVVVDNLRKLRR